MSRNLSAATRATAPSRLFLFAGYTPGGTIDANLLHYLGVLSSCGDIVFVMDNDTPASELEKLSQIPNILHISATRHGEYDFGSYKRGYIWARDNKKLKKYDWVYLVNDSVYGPLSDLKPLLDRLESSDAAMTGLIGNSDDVIPFHVQSWFVGLAPSVFNSAWFNTFISDICAYKDKQDIVLHCEVSLTQTAIRNGVSIFALMPDAGRTMYSDIFNALRGGVPFVKKTSLRDNPPNPRYLIPYATDKKIIEMIYSELVSNGINWPTGDVRFDYHRSFRLTLLGIPLLTIYRKTLHRQTDYKFCIFDRIAICKISYTKKD